MMFKGYWQNPAVESFKIRLQRAVGFKPHIARHDIIDIEC